LIIDLVNNFKNVQLASFKSDFEQELNASAGGKQITGNKKTKAAIEFIDEIQDIRKIFTSFDEATDVWKRFYERAKLFYLEHGHLYVPAADRELYDWVRFQRNECRLGRISKDRDALLRAIGIGFEKKISHVWINMLHELEEWIEKNGPPPFELKLPFRIVDPASTKVL
jgi:hypothetical protein